eukprot:COSAG02_NODE_12068_length_1604_cov_1.106977_2_plen_301_part_00
MKERDDAIHAKTETQNRAERWIRKIQDARAKERSAHERELMDCDARREVAESKLHELSSRFQQHRNERWGGDGDGGPDVVSIGADWADTLSVNSAGSAPTHLAGKVLLHAAMGGGGTTQVARRPAAKDAGKAKSKGGSRIPSDQELRAQVQRADQRTKVASRSRGADQVVRAARGGDSRSGKGAAPAAPAPADHSTVMPAWHTLVAQTRKLHADKGSASLEKKPRPALAMGSAGGLRGKHDGSSSSSSSSSSSGGGGNRASSETPTSENQVPVPQPPEPVPGASGKGRWAARAAAARRER